MDKQDQHDMRLKKGDELLPMVKPTVYSNQSKEIKHQARRISELEQERDQLAAQNAEQVNVLHEAHQALEEFIGVDTNGNASDAMAQISRVLGAPSGYSLADMQAKAIEHFQTYFDKEYYGEELSQFIEQYADKLRQQAQSATPADIGTQVIDEQEK